MTRDTLRVVDDHDADAEVFSALWAAAPSFPQLPPDAPPELRSLAFEVRDPKSVYAIYRASRRHNFQLLVERYITQLRYGCQDAHCNISTCFTCRRRSAGSKPLRRYNTTSARTLACFLASQDNPEKGLCQALSLPRKASGHSRISSITRTFVEAPGKDSIRSKPSKAPSHNRSRPPAGKGVPDSPKANDPRPYINGAKPSVEIKQAGVTKEDADTDQVCASLERPVKKDHKSFVQNMFGTVAFRMLEWLTPKTLEALITADTNNQDSRPSNHETESAVEGGEPPESVDNPQGQSLPLSQESSRSGGLSTGLNLSQSAEIDKPLSPGSSTLPSTLDGQIDPPADSTMYRRTPNHPPNRNRRSRDVEESVHQQLPLPSTVHRSSSTMAEKDRDPMEHTLPRNGINSQIPKPQEIDVNRRHPVENQEPASPKRTRRRAPSTISPKVFPGQDDMSLYGGISQALPLLSPRHTPYNRYTDSENDGGTKLNLPNGKPHGHEKPPGAETTPNTAAVKFPQSLTSLSIEVIDLFYKISQEDTHFDLRSTSLDLSLQNEEGPRRRRDAATDDCLVTSSNPHPIEMTRLPGTGPLWRNFIEQSLFNALSNYSSSSCSFHNCGRLFDTQTLWYCMVRLIRHFPSLVFDSLWISAAALYSIPHEVKPFLDPPERDSAGTERFAFEDAADIMSLCLHALIAAVPYVRDPVDLFTISRIRSYGLSTSQGRRMSKELAQMCLVYDDIFSDEMAVRLARRVFAAIPAIQMHQVVLALNKPSDASNQRPDILELVLAPLNFLDIEVPPILDFSPEERQLHEKRAPTLLIDWARTVMLKDWNGLPVVPSRGSFGGALAMMQAIHFKRKTLLLGDVHFRTEYFADHMDIMGMPVEWLSWEHHPNKKTVHLLDYPWLFSPSTLVTYFRVINFSQMNRAFETSGSVLGRVHATISSSSLMTDAGRREDLFDRLRTATSKFLVLQIRRTHVLNDAFDHLWRREKRELSRPLKIRLGEDSGEEGSDSGGVQQEFFRLAIAEALNPDYGAFTIDERTRMAWFQPSSLEPVWKFELIGLLVSLAIYNGLTLPVTFPKALYRKLLGFPVTELHHIEDGWPDLASGLSSLLEWDEKEGLVEDVFSRTYEFTIDSFGQQISRDMAAGTKWPQYNELSGNNPVDARLVTSENRNEYVSDYIKWLTDISIRPQFEAFKRGFFLCLECRSLKLFDPDILQSVVEGVQEIDISELRRYTRYVGWVGEASHRTIKDFWSIVKKYGPEEKKKLLEFVTASDRVPVGGTRNLAFVIQRNGVGDIDGHLPTSYTCYGTLLLPEYSSKDILREKLGMALENAKGFGFA